MKPGADFSVDCRINLTTSKSPSQRFYPLSQAKSPPGVDLLLPKSLNEVVTLYHEWWLKQRLSGHVIIDSQHDEPR